MQCEVCARNEAKYTCPRCEVRTCCLQCTNIHKKELECTGLRDRVKFKRLKDFDNIDLLNDYRLLEETARVVSKPVRLPPMSCYDERWGGLPLDLYRLKCATSRRGVQLHFLPPDFSRRRRNTTRLDHQSQTLGWRLDWVFPQADHITLTDDCVPDLTLLSACLHRWLDPEQSPDPALAFYQSAGHAGVKMLLRADRTTANRYFLLDSTTTLRENLTGKSIIEYPVIFVILNHHIDMYYVLSPEEEDELHKRQRRRVHTRKRLPDQPNNFLFSSSRDEGEVNDKMEEGTSATPENNDQPGDSIDKNKFRLRGRGMGRGRGMEGGREMGGRGRGRIWRARGRGRFHHRRGNWHNDRSQQDFSAENINTNVSSDFSSVNLQSGANIQGHNQ